MTRTIYGEFFYKVPVVGLLTVFPAEECTTVHVVSRFAALQVYSPYARPQAQAELACCALHVCIGRRAVITALCGPRLASLHRLEQKHVYMLCLGLWHITSGCWTFSHSLKCSSPAHGHPADATPPLTWTKVQLFFPSTRKTRCASNPVL